MPYLLLVKTKGKDCYCSKWDVSVLINITCSNPYVLGLQQYIWSCKLGKSQLWKGLLGPGKTLGFIWGTVEDLKNINNKEWSWERNDIIRFTLKVILLWVLFAR